MWWEKVIVKITGEDGKGPGKRWGHTCNTIKGGRFIYVFGGYGENNSQTNKVYVFRTLIQSWSQPEMKGHPPIPRDSHTCSTIGDNLFVFGGTDGVNPLNDLHFLDTSSHTWISPSIRGDGPAAREGHSAAVVGKRLFIFGGCGKSADNGSDVYYNDLYILNTETFVWRCATTSGTPPSPRDSHSCSSWKNKIIVVGGEDGHDYYLSDVHILDTDTLIWRKLATSGQLMPPRAGHSAVCFGKHLFVFGGFTDAQNLYNDLYMLDIDTGVWTNITTTTNSPSARFSVAGDSVDPIKSGVLVFIGGCNKSLEGLDDMFYLYTGMTRESGQRQEKLSLKKQLKLKCQEQNLNPAQNMVRYRVGTDIRPRITVLNCSQPSGLNVPASQLMPPPGKKMFAAKVTKNISEGYAIETVIDGKPLRGILFHNKPISLHPSDLTPTRKRAADEDGSITPNGAHTDTSKSPKVSEIQNRHAVHGDSSESHYHHHTEAHASISHKISADREPEVASSSQIDGEKYETPKSSSEVPANDVVNSASEVPANDVVNSASEVPANDVVNSASEVPANDVVNSASEVPANDQTNVPISNAEVPSHDIKNDAPNCNTGFPKPATTESAACPSNQDELIGATMDCTASRTEESSEPAMDCTASRTEESSEPAMDCTASRTEESSEPAMDCTASRTEESSEPAKST